MTAMLRTTIAGSLPKPAWLAEPVKLWAPWRLEGDALAEGKRGPQALSVRLLEAPVSLAKRSRKPADDMAVIIEDLVKLLDGIGGDLRRGRYPSGAHGKKVAAVLRKVADELDA